MSIIDQPFWKKERICSNLFLIEFDVWKDGEGVDEGAGCVAQVTRANQLVMETLETRKFALSDSWRFPKLTS